MNNLFTIIDELLDNHLSETYEISELANAPTLAVSVEDGNVTFTGTLSKSEGEYIVAKNNWKEILPTLKQNFTLMGYVVNGEFYTFAIFMQGEDYEMSPKRRAAFMELYNSSPAGLKLRHVPVNSAFLNLDGAKRALENGSKREDVVKYTIKAIVDLCGGPSPLTGGYRRGLAFKSLSSTFSFKCYSEYEMQRLGGLV